MDPSKPHLKVFAFLVAGMFILVVGITFQLDQMYLMALSVLLIPVFAVLVGKWLSGGLACERAVPETAFEGETVRVDLTLTNTARLPRFYIQVDDQLPDQIQRTDASQLIVLQLEPGASRSISYGVTPEMRGVFKIGPAVLQTTDPFGLTRARRRLNDASDLVVLPTPLPVRRTILAGGAYGFRGERDGTRRGIGMDFYGIRDYRHGDELRTVHWRTTARTGHLVVVEQTQGESISVVLALDLSAGAYKGSGEGPESALEYAVKITATIGDCLIRDGHAVRLVTAQGELLVDATSDIGSFPLLEFLARVQGTASTPLGQVLEAAAGVGPGASNAPSRGVSPASAVARSGGSRTAVAPAPAVSATDLPSGGALVYITTDAPGEGLGEALALYAGAGLSVHGFMIDRGSFTGRVVEPVAPPPIGTLHPVARGVDLLRVIEGMGHGR